MNFWVNFDVLSVSMMTEVFCYVCICVDVLNADSSSSCCDSRYKAIYALVSHETQFCDPTQKQALSKVGIKYCE